MNRAWYVYITIARSRDLFVIGRCMLTTSYRTSTPTTRDSSNRSPCVTFSSHNEASRFLNWIANRFHWLIISSLLGNRWRRRLFLACATSLSAAEGRRVIYLDPSDRRRTIQRESLTAAWVSDDCVLECWVLLSSLCLATGDTRSFTDVTTELVREGVVSPPVKDDGILETQLNSVDVLRRKFELFFFVSLSALSFVRWMTGIAITSNVYTEWNI